MCTTTSYIAPGKQHGTFTSTCGGIEGAIERGTTVLVERTVVYDIVERMGDYDEHIADYTTVLDLDWVPERLPKNVRKSHMVSGDRDLAEDDLPELRSKYGAVVGDWESGSIAWVAKRNGLRCLILRGVSDLVGRSGGEVYGNMRGFEENARAVMRELIGQLPFWIHASSR